MKRQGLSAYLRVWRAIALYAIFVAVAGIACFFFVFFSYSLSDRPLGETLDRELLLFPFLVQSIVLFFFFGSLLRVFAVRDGSMREEIYTDASCVKGLRDCLRAVLGARLFWIETAVLWALPLLLPMECGFYPLHFVLFGGATLGRAVQKLLLLAILWPMIFALNLWQRIAALYTWQEAELAGQSTEIGRLGAPIAATSLFYGAALLFIPPIVSVLLAALAALAAISTSLVGVAIAGVCLLLFLWRYPRALLIRRKFLKNLRKRCAECGFVISKIKRPYASVFRIRGGVDLTVTANGKSYDCKLLAGLSRYNAMALSPDGVASVIHVIGLRIGPRHSPAGMRATFFHAPDGKADRMLHARWFQHLELFRFTTKTDFSFQGEHKKILIVNPVPYALFGGTEQHARPIDNGDTVGEYKVFAGTAFLNALERDCLEK